MKVLVVENDPLVAFDLNDMLRELEYPELPVADSVDLALKLIEQEKPDVVLVDIELNGERNGLDLGVILNELNIPFIYLTGLRQRPILDQAMQTNPHANLAKPVNKWQLRNSLVEIHKKAESSRGSDFIMVSEKDQKIRINKEDIIFLLAARNNCEIHTIDKRYVSSVPMNHVWKKINQSDFIQVHRSRVINVTRVERYMGNTIYFQDTDKEVVMSQSFRSSFLDHFDVV